jgi:hypothetical protein
MLVRWRMLRPVGLVLLAGAAAWPAAGTARQREETPTMTNSTVERAPEPLPADWPARAADAQLRGASCETAYGKEGGRQFAEPGDDVLPVVGTMTANAGSAFRAVRHVPFLTRRDVARAALVADPDDASVFEVRLTLTEEGAAKAKQFTDANVGKCVALVAGNVVVWSAPLDTPVDGDTFALSGSFSGQTGIAIVDMFEGR